VVAAGGLLPLDDDDPLVAALATPAVPTASPLAATPVSIHVLRR
jgi:hypothetical protein